MSFILNRGSDTVTLKNPSLGNKYTLDTGLVSRTSRAGKQLQYLDPNTQMITSESLTFTNVKKADVDDLIVFLGKYRGKLLNVTTRGILIPAYIQNDVIDYVCDRETICSSFYTFDMIVTYTYQAILLVAEDFTPLVTETDDYLTTER